MKVDQCVEVYIERKRAAGFIYTGAGKVLRRFARFVGKIRISHITEYHVNAFLTRCSISNNCWRLYWSHLHRFFVYWFARRHLRRIPRLEPKPRIAPTFYPYVYTRAEIRGLVAATVVCQKDGHCIVNAETLKTIILFLYGTGVKVGDALMLSDSDVDLRGGSIEIRGESNSDSRRIPIGRDIRRLVRRYLGSEQRRKFGLGRPLFLTLTGGSIRYGVLGPTFIRLRRIAGVTRTDSSYQPRLNDLRHTFAVHSIARWTRDGLSIDKLLPILAAYMGNRNLQSFERYMELSPSRYQAQLDRLKILAETK